MQKFVYGICGILFALLATFHFLGMGILVTPAYKVINSLSDSNTSYVHLDQLPYSIKNIVIEDINVEIPDVDFKHAFKAIWNKLDLIEENGVVKYLVGEPEERSILQKLLASGLVIRFNKLSSTRQSELIVNTMHFGNGVDGLEEASNYYFQKSIQELSQDEIWFLLMQWRLFGRN